MRPSASAAAPRMPACLSLSASLRLSSAARAAGPKRPRAVAAACRTTASFSDFRVLIRGSRAAFASAPICPSVWAALRRTDESASFKPTQTAGTTPRTFGPSSDSAITAPWRCSTFASFWSTSCHWAAVLPRTFGSSSSAGLAGTTRVTSIDVVRTTVVRPRSMVMSPALEDQRWLAPPPHDRTARITRSIILGRCARLPK